MRHLWMISGAAALFILASGLAAQAQTDNRVLLGKVFHRGDHGEAVPERGLIVTLVETGDSDDTNDLGIFRLPLLPEPRPGDPITIAIDKPGWRIRYPLDGELLMPRQLAKALEVELLPLGSKLFWESDGRIEKFIRDSVERSKREGRTLDLGFYIREWATKYGFSPREAREQVDRWIADVEASHEDNYRQGLADLAKLQFDQAAARFHDSAEREIRQFEEAQKRQAEENAASRERIVRYLKLEGDSHYSAYRYQQALALYERAHQYTSREETSKLWVVTLNDIGDTHRQLGSLGPTKESAEHLSQAVAAFQQALLVAAPGRLPRQWAAVQNNLAATLFEQGTRAPGEPGIQLVGQAVAALRQVVLYFPRDRFPEEWSTAQTNLGTALEQQGALVAGEPGNQLLAEAVAAFREVFLVLSRDHFPQEWASAQNSLGIALRDQGLRAPGEPGRQLLAQALGAHRQALLVFTRDGPWSQDWVTTQINLGNALKDQGTRTAGQSGNQFLAQAVDAYRQALPVSTLPQNTGMLHHNLGLALKEQGIRTDGALSEQLLAQAVDAYRQALLFYSQDNHPLLWAEAQNNLGLAFQELGTRTDGDSGNQLLAQAIDAYRETLHVFTRDKLPQKWAMAQSNLGIALAHLGDRTAGEQGNQFLAQAVEIYRGAMSVRTQDEMPQPWAVTQINLGAALQEQGRRMGGESGNRLLVQALDATRQALLVFTLADMPYAWQIAKGNEAEILVDLGRNEEAIQTLTQILDQVPDDRRAFLALAKTLNDRLFDPERAAALTQSWLQQHPDDQEARTLYSELLFAAKSITECRQEIAAILSLKGSAIEPATRIVLLAYSIAADLATQAPGAQDRIKEIITLADQQPPNFKISRSFPGTLHSLEASPELPHRDLINRLFRTLNAPDRDTLIKGLRELQEETGDHPRPEPPGEGISRSTVMRSSSPM